MTHSNADQHSRITRNVPSGSEFSVDPQTSIAVMVKSVSAISQQTLHNNSKAWQGINNYVGMVQQQRLR